jgi:CBS domain-containing protein
VGVVSKSDLVRHLARAGSAQSAAAGLLTRGFVSCRPEDDLRGAWQRMNALRLQNLSVLGENGTPVGVLDIRDAMRAILEADELEKRALADYIAGVGYL